MIGTGVITGRSGARRFGTFQCRVAVALCLTWTSATRDCAQASNPPSNQSDLDNPDSAGGDAVAYGDAGQPANGSAAQLPPFGGPWNSRPKLTGDWCCLREAFRDNGYTFDISNTEYYQGTASGGLKDGFRYGGRDDYLVNVDGQKAGLWQGLGINLHGETVYGDSVNLFTGAIVPVNIGRAHPVFFGNTTALTAVKFTQVVSENLVLYAGKINTIDNIQQPFMRGRGLDAGFMNAALVWNPILGRTLNYATLGAGAAILMGGQPVFTLTVYDTNNDSTTSGFDVLFNNGAVIFPQVILPTTFFGLPGHQSLWRRIAQGATPYSAPTRLTSFRRPDKDFHLRRILFRVRGGPRTCLIRRCGSTPRIQRGVGACLATRGLAMASRIRSAGP
jgi:hypothetical protein